MTPRATASAGMAGNGPRLGRRQEPRPAGREPYGRGEPTPGSRPRLRRSLAARRYVPTGTGPRVRQRLTGQTLIACRAVLVVVRIGVTVPELRRIDRMNPPQPRVPTI